MLLRNIIVALLTASLLLACASAPKTNSELSATQQRLNTLENDSNVQRYAGKELDDAAVAVNRAVETWQDTGASGRYRHHLYVAKRHLDIAEEQTGVKAIQARADSLAQQREQLRLQARAVRAELAEARAQAEAARAGQLAAQSAAEAQTARQERFSAERQRELAEAERLAAQQQRLEAERERSLAEQRRAEAEQQRAQAQAEAAQANSAAAQAQQELAELRRQLADMQAEETERGLQLTLQDVLFDFNAADLKTGAERQMAKLAEFLTAYPNRQVSIEGFTDSVGSESYNQSLSEQRANSVRDALVANGVASRRVVTHGFGEDYPLASNNNDTGRAQNRRVEIIISYDDQPVPARTDDA